MTALAVQASVLSPTRSSRRGRSFDEVRDDVATRAALAFPDKVVRLSDLHVTDAGTVEVPAVGTLSLTDWSQKQLARTVGVRWDRWFAEELVSPAERAGELNRRLERHTGEWKVRARRHEPAESVIGDGVLRAFVGPGYQPIDDVRIFDRLARVLGPRTGDFRFTRTDVTDETSQYLAVTEDEIDLGVTKPDPHKNGFLVANSEVGARALGIIEYVLRVVCSNGLTVAIAGRRLFYRVHRKTAEESIDRDLAYAISQLPERWDRGIAALRAARAEAISEPEHFIEELLAGEPGFRRHTDLVLGAFRAEREPTRFGVIQALTGTAQTLPPEGRLALEQFAGRLLAGRAQASPEVLS